ncbi:MAG TPA: hypothetical protein PLY87_24030, partial [Planctomycetaceae bacterium]|nr:hypothetical protein [Planctomycetaceae bacterium]
MIDLSDSPGNLSGDVFFVDEIFVRPSQPDAPPELTPKAIAVLSAPWPLVQIPFAALCSLLWLSEEAAIRAATEIAEAWYRAEPVPAAVHRLCTAGLEIVRPIAIAAREEQAAARKEMKSCPLEEYVRDPSSQPSGWWSIPAIFAAVLGVLL